MRRILTLMITLALPTIPLAALGDKPVDDRARALINLDGPGIVGLGLLAGRADARFFNHPEGITYTSLVLRYGLYHHLEIGIRGVASTTQSWPLPGGGAVPHGGSDAEIYGKYDLGSFGGFRLAITGGASSPDTPAQNQANGTVSGSASIKLHERLTAHLNSRAIFPKDNTIVGIGGGADVTVSHRVHLVGDWTKIVSGDNTRDTVTGARKRGDIWGAAIRFSAEDPSAHVDLDIGYGNGTGTTTGFSLTPGLGNSAAVYFALHLRR